jgi:chromosome partitioning protein
MIIFVGHEKGGLGKSTIAITVAAFIAQNRKNKVVLVDTDSSRSASRWGSLRTDFGLEHHFAIMDKVEDPTAHILKLSEVYDVVVVDVGAGDYARIAEMSRIADLWIAPTCVGQKEGDSNVNLIEAFEHANKKHKSGRVPLIFAFNKTPSSTQSSETTLAKSALQEFAPEIPVMESVMCDRKVWRDADRAGRTIFEMPQRNREKAETEFLGMISEALKAANTYKKQGA